MPEELDSASGQAGQAPLRVLVVDDEPLVRQGLRSILSADPGIHAVVTGDGILYPASVRDLVLGRTTRASYAGEPLTARESEVLELMAEGLGNAAIATRLVLGVETVRTHVAGVLRKLGARDRTHAVVLAYSQGLVRIDGR